MRLLVQERVSNTKWNEKKIIQWMVVCSIGLFPCVGQAFGVSPAVVEINDLLSESSAEATIYISRTNPSTTDTVTVTVSGTGAAAVVLSDTTITLPQGEVSVPFTFSIQPVDLVAGAYTVAMTFLYQQADATVVTSAMGVQSGIEASIQFSVTNDQITNLSVSGIEITQADTALPHLKYVLTNTGNTAAGPTSLSLQYTDNQAKTIVTVMVPAGI